MSLTADDGVVDPWVVLRRLMAENRELRAERDALHARVDELQLRLVGTSPGDVPTTTPECDAPAAGASSTQGAPSQPPPSVAPATEVPPAPSASVVELPDIWSKLRPWQQDAMTAWRSADRRGVVEAVTGAGKTFLGICAARDALAGGGRAVVVVPTIELQDQWWRVLAEQLPHADIGKLGGGRQDELSDCDVLVAIVHSAARRSLRPRPGDVLIADECHRYGAPSFAEALEQGFDRRLGLTATFEREDDGVDQYLRPYFGDVVLALWYDRALADGVIAPFDIALASVELTVEEQRDYDACGERMDVAARNLEWRHGISREPYGQFMAELNRLAKDRGNPASSAARSYLGPMTARRALLAASSGKLDVLAGLEPAVRSAQGALVFTQTKESAESAAGLFKEVGIPASALYSGLDRGERRDQMDAFRERASRLLAAPRVLDEGVDVPEADLAIIVAGSRSRRQLVQRLGRVLRPKADGRSARLVMLYAKRTIEDPTLYGDSPLAAVLPHSRRRGDFSLPDDRGELLQFLLGETYGASQSQGASEALRTALAPEPPAIPSSDVSAPATKASVREIAARKPSISPKEGLNVSFAAKDDDSEVVDGGMDFEWDEEGSGALRQERKGAEAAAAADPVRTYLKQIGRSRLLTADEEVDLAERIETGIFARLRLDD